MKRYFLLFSGCLLSGSVLAADKEGILSKIDKMINIETLLFIAGFIIFLYLVKRLYDARNRISGKSDKNGKLTKDNIYQPRYWYQCKNCRLTVRKDSPPNTAECFNAVDHAWTQLAEVGTGKYLCKNCNTLIEAKSEPVKENCLDAEFHNWEKLES